MESVNVNLKFAKLRSFREYFEVETATHLKHAIRAEMTPPMRAALYASLGGHPPNDSSAILYLTATEF